MTDVSRILHEVDDGDPQAASRLLPLVYDELRKLAAAKLAHEKPGHTLDATALVHEAYLRLTNHDAAVAFDAISFENRRHFFAAAAEAMRRILVENARRKGRQKHGGNLQRVDFCPDDIETPQIDERMVALDDALKQFAIIEPEKVELLKLKAFAGLTLDEAAEVLGISPTTADRWWAYARAWLRLEIAGENSEP